MVPSDTPSIIAFMFLIGLIGGPIVFLLILGVSFSLICTCLVKLTRKFSNISKG